jgi:hypothetical protein
MALVFQRNEIGFERTGRTVTVPNNDVARLMYYLNCVCVAIDCNHDPDIQRFTSYQNWSYLSIEEQKALLVVCYACSPDVLDDRVFFHSEALCGDSTNEFYTVNQVRNRIVAAESIIIAGQVRQVNKIMTYKMQWMKTYYFDPMQRLVARISAPPARPALAYTPLIVNRPYIQQRSNRKKWISVLVIVIIIIVVISYFVRQNSSP